MKLSPYKWIFSADKVRGKKNLRFCPGVYLPTGEYHDVWLYTWLEQETSYNNFDELWKSGDVIFLRRWQGVSSDEDSRTKKDTKHDKGSNKIQ